MNKLKASLLYIFFFIISCNSFAQENLYIKRIKIKGQSAFTAPNIKENLTLASTSWFKEKIQKKEAIPFTNKLLQEDLQSLNKEYQKEGYLNVSFDPPKFNINKKNKLKLTIIINEGDPVKVSDVDYLVDSTYTIKEALPNIGRRHIILQSQLLTNKIFRDEAFLNDHLLITEEFGNIGYPYAQVDYDLKVDTIALTAQLKWLIDKGSKSYFGNTQVEGNERIPDKSILRQLAYKKGDVWSVKKIDQTQKHIYMQGMYRVSSVNAQLSEQKNDTIPITIRIKEAPRWTTTFGVGYGREDKFRTFAEFQYLSFITKTGRIQLFGKHSGLEPYTFSFKFFQPSVFFPINTLVLNPYVQSENEPGYKVNIAGFNALMLQNFSKYFNTTIGYEYEDVRLDTTNIADVEDDVPIDSLYNKAGIIIGGIYNNANPILDPVQGYSISMNFKTNKLLLGGDMPFYKVLAEYKSYFGFRPGLVLAWKVKFGASKRADGDDLLPVEERFFSGGSHSVRGWPRSELGPKDAEGVPIGGNSLLEGSAELRLSLGKRISMNLFWDTGNVWQKSFTYDLNDLHYSAGAGIQFKTPIGPAGLEFARPIFEDKKDWQIHFNIGYAF